MSEELKVNIESCNNEINEYFVGRNDGTSVLVRSRLVSGKIAVSDTEIVFDKYFNYYPEEDYQSDYIILKPGQTPDLQESFDRFNRAATMSRIGSKGIKADITIKPSANYLDSISDEMPSDLRMVDFEVDVVPPLTVNDMAELDEFDVGENGEGFFWARISNDQFEVHIDNPNELDISPSFAVFVITKSPEFSDINPAGLRWDYVDALLTPSSNELPGLLASNGLRSALIDLQPDRSEDILIS